jgi:hypothetical protein
MQVDSESADELPPSLLVMIVIKGQVERPSEARIILYGNKSTVLLTILSRPRTHLKVLSCLINHTSGLKRYPASAGTSLHRIRLIIWDNRNSPIQFLHPSSISHPS